jgi:CRISPR-associated endonuclease/helicase Cas3
MLNQILAKYNPEISLPTHTNQALAVWKTMKERWENTIETDEHFWYRSFLSVLFHDAGKITDNFQDIIKKKKSYFDNENIRHEFISTAVLLANETKYYMKSPLSLYAVMSHHKPLTDEIFSDNIYKDLKLKSKLLEGFIEYAKKEVKKNWNKDFKSDTRLPEFISKAKLDTLYLMVFEKLFKANTARLTFAERKQYIFYKAILQISDWIGSGSGELSKNLNFDISFLEKVIVQKLEQDGKHDIAQNFSWRKFQKESILKSHVIVIAPTGSGKTEAALLWASKKSENSKILYLLPTRVTSNAIYQRLKSYFDTKSVAVVHSSAKFYRKEIEGDYSGFDYLYDRTFFRNISVCTIDQLLTQGFNLGFWELKTFHCLNAHVIIDEIHLYAPYTLGLVIASIRYLKIEFGTNFYIMSATMPQKLRNLLSKTLGEKSGNIQIIEDTELLDKARNTFEIRKKPVDDIKNEIVKQIEADKKVLVVVNTVDEAIKLYEKYKKFTENIICYHSRFIQKDRVKKEKDILAKEKEDTGFLLIATQVVEVSLDIDFDILFTENAPIDAIIQRAGRVNRKRKKTDSKVVVFQENEITSKWVYDEPGILKNTFLEIEKWHGKKPTEINLNEMVDRVYKDMDIENNEHYIKGLQIYQKIQKKNHFVKDNLNADEVYTREGLDTINVIPDCFEGELGDAPIEEKAKHELSVRKSKEYKIEVYWDKRRQFRYIKADYSYEKGLEFRNSEYNVYC